MPSNGSSAHTASLLLLLQLQLLVQQSNCCCCFLSRDFILQMSLRALQRRPHTARPFYVPSPPCSACLPACPPAFLPLTPCSTAAVDFNGCSVARRESQQRCSHTAANRHPPPARLYGQPLLVPLPAACIRDGIASTSLSLPLPLPASSPF